MYPISICTQNIVSLQLILYTSQKYILHSEIPSRGMENKGPYHQQYWCNSQGISQARVQVSNNGIILELDGFPSYAVPVDRQNFNMFRKSNNQILYLVTLDKYNTRMHMPAFYRTVWTLISLPKSYHVILTCKYFSCLNNMSMSKWYQKQIEQWKMFATRCHKIMVSAVWLPIFYDKFSTTTLSWFKAQCSVPWWRRKIIMGYLYGLQ